MKIINPESILIATILNYQKFKEIYGDDDLYNKIIADIYKKIDIKYVKDLECKKMFSICKNFYINNIIVSYFRITDILQNKYNYTNADATNIYYQYLNINIVCDENEVADVINQILTKGHLEDVQKLFRNVDISIKKKNIEEVYEKIEKLFKEWNYSIDVDTISIGEVAKKVMKNIEDIIANPHFFTGLSTGINQLDAITRGFQPGNFIILAARPSFGKTALAVNIARNIFSKSKLEANDRILFINLEMSKEEVTKRFISLISGVSNTKMGMGKLSKTDTTALRYATVQMEESPIILNQISSLNIEKIAIIAKDLARHKQLKLIIVDYLQLIETSGTISSSTTREQQVSNISRRLKLLAGTLNCPILALSQLSRKTETRENKIPLMSDLRESGSLEQDADLIMFLYREHYYSFNKDNKNDIIYKNNEPIELMIAKNRHGSIGSIKMMFYKNIGAFEEVLS